MTTQEFSNMFDTLLNSYNTLANFGEQASKNEIVLDEYEKSVFLTLALDIIVKLYFDRNLNQQGLGFDDSARRQIDFSSLIVVKEFNSSSNSNTIKYDDRSIIFNLSTTSDNTSSTADTDNDNRILFILNEKLIIKNKTTTSKGESTTTKSYTIVPINYKEYDRKMSKAYTLPLKKLAWRLFDNTSNNASYIEVIPVASYKPEKTENNTVTYTYKVRYIRRPRPIILTNILDDGLDIDGVSEVSECELNPILHMDVLNKALEIAMSTRGGRPLATALNERIQLQ